MTCETCGGAMRRGSDVTAQDGVIEYVACVQCGRSPARSPEVVASLMAERGVGDGRKRPVYPRQPQTMLQPGSRISRGKFR